jgi:hypothetical protein
MLERGFLIGMLAIVLWNSMSLRTGGTAFLCSTRARSSKAAAKDNEDAMFYLGALYENGQGITCAPVDPLP